MSETAIDVWHGMGSLVAYVAHDGQNGNAADTMIEFDFCESQKPSIEITKDKYGEVQGFRLDLLGDCERRGMARLLSEVAQELDKAADQLGQHQSIDLIAEEDDVLSEAVEPSIEQKGLLGEAALNSWLQSIGISYLHLSQTPETFASLFQGHVKRPDFLVLLESVGMVAVDVKNYTLFNGEYSLPFEKELKRVLAFERLFRIPVWYAYMGEQSNGSPSWYWISALKALEVGKVRVNSNTDEEFLTIKRRHFEHIESGDDLGKLYTHRLPSLKKTAALETLKSARRLVSDDAR